MVAVMLAFTAVVLLLNAFAGQAPSTAFAPAQDRTLYFPAVFSPASPAGTYDCLEYEFGLIWTSEVVTLNPDGSSVYAGLSLQVNKKALVQLPLPLPKDPVFSPT